MISFHWMSLSIFECFNQHNLLIFECFNHPVWFFIFKNECKWALNASIFLKKGKQKRRKSLKFKPFPTTTWLDRIFFFISKIRNWRGDVIFVWKNSLRQALPANGPHLAWPRTYKFGFVWFHRVAYIVSCKFATFGFWVPLCRLFSLFPLWAFYMVCSCTIQLLCISSFIEFATEKSILT